MVMANVLLLKVPRPISIIFLVGFSVQFSTVLASQKCWKRNWNQSLSDNVQSYPEVQVTKLVPISTARRLENVKERQWNATSQDLHMTVPTMLETLRLQCSAKYKIQWGFESFPWITFDTWTGASLLRSHENESQTYTATVEFHKVQETSLQTRTPICYSVLDPCIQTAVEPRSGPGNTVEMTFVSGSHYAIQSKSDKEQFGNNTNCTLQFGYDAKSQKFYCTETDPSKPQASGKIFLRSCPDPVTCDSLITQSNCTAHQIPPISECTAGNRCRNETAFAGKFPGVAVCHSGSPLEHSVAIPYFFALGKLNSFTNRTARYIHWNDANPSDMLTLQKFDQPLYTKQKISVVCNSSYFYLGTGMYMTLFKEDSPSIGPGEEASIEKGREENLEILRSLQTERNELESAKESVTYEDANISGIGSKLPVTRSLEAHDFEFKAAGKYKLSCFAPVWNTTEWAEASSTVFVKESVFPEFVDGNMTVKLYYASFRKLECVSFGIPKPTLDWTRDGGSVPSEVNLVTGEQNQTLVWAILTLPKLEYGIQGNFTCTSTNVAGTSKKTFIIIPADKNSSTAMWVLIGLAILVTFFIPLILYLTWKVRRQRRFIDDLTQEEVDEFINGRPDYVPFHCDMSIYAYYLPYDKSYELPREALEIDLKRVLGSGEYGLVLYGLYKNANPPEGQPMVKPVAIKTTKPLSSGKESFKALLSELKIMTYIGSHENIVNLIGACTQSIKKREVLIATEYCENGSLLGYLRMNRYVYENPLFYAELMHSNRDSALSAETSFINPIGLTKGDGIKPEVVDVQYVRMEDLGNFVVNPQYENIRNIKLYDLMQWSFDIARGMEFLASKKVIHGDLAARNILLTRNLRCKIGDFGLSRQLFHYNYYTKTAVTPLPLKWLAIECLQNFQFSVESDVWAYGITLFEIFSIGEIPYTSVQMNGEEFLRALKHGMRLSKPANAPADVFDLMMACWKHDRKQRPSFSDIVKFFHMRLNKNINTTTKFPDVKL